MATNPIERGPTSQRVAENVAAVRKDLRRLSLRDLSERLRALGRAVMPSGISKVEVGDRRVDVDDLVALAAALEVSPNRLLLTPQARDDEVVSLTGDLVVTEMEAWQWADGKAFLPGLMSGMDLVYIDRFDDLWRECRPHDEFFRWTTETVERHREVLESLRQAVLAGIGAGIPDEVIKEYVGQVTIRAWQERQAENRQRNSRRRRGKH